MRLLHAGHGHELRGAAGAQSSTECRRRSRGDQRPHLPLRYLSACRRRDARGCQRPQGVIMANEAIPANRNISLRHRQRRPRQGRATNSGSTSRRRSRLTAELSVIGKSVPRHNGRAKVTGAARFTVDVGCPACCMPASCVRRCRMHGCVPSTIRGGAPSRRARDRADRQSG